MFTSRTSSSRTIFLVFDSNTVFEAFTNLIPISDFGDFKISDIFPFHSSISAEVVGNTAEEMLDQAEELIDIGPNITIKVPCTPQGLKACKDLTDDEVSVNVTLIFSAAQAILASKAGATFVSPFVGRVFDQSFDGIGLIEEISDISVSYTHLTLPTKDSV